MLYTIFLYQSESGLLLFDKSFQDVSHGKMELFGSFFSALKTFIGEMLLDGSKELKNIELGDYSVLITSVNEIKADLVVIGDKEDYKSINKLIPKIIKVLGKYPELFLEWKGNRKDFDILDQPISELILSQKRLLGEKSLIERQEHILKSMWAHKKDLSSQQIDNLILEKKMLMEILEKSTVLPQRLALVEKLLEISEKLKDERDFIKFQSDLKIVKDEIRDSKIKLNYYLEKIKNTINQAVKQLGNKPLNQGDYKDVYLNLYSFSNKLKNMSNDNKWQEYRDLAISIINKDEISVEEISQTISAILKMSENIEDYLN
jgi:hypothetical protein